MKIRALIFDFDGVICDSVDVKTQAFATLYSSYGLEIQKIVVNYHLLNGGISRFKKIKYFEEILLQKKTTEEEINILADKFSALVKEKVIASQYIKGADLFIKKYSNLIPQYICTGTPESEILEILKVKGIDIFFRSIYGSPKSKEKILNEIINVSEIKPSEMIYFGDAITDFNAAKKFKIPFIGIKNSHTSFPLNTIIVRDFEDELLNEYFPK